MSTPRVRLARPDERGALIELQRRASLALDDYREQLEANPDAIDLPTEQITGGEVVVAEVGGQIVGFAVVLVENGRAMLDGLFVAPERWRQGIGARLIERAVAEAGRRGFATLGVAANPTARVFYERCGFRVVGEIETRFGPALAMSR